MHKINHLMFRLRFCSFGLLAMAPAVWAQKAPELETALIKVNRIWTGVTANGGKGSFDYRAGFFPNDFDIIGVRGQEQDLWPRTPMMSKSLGKKPAR